MRDPGDDLELARRFRESSTSHSPRAPLYAALADGCARDPDLYRLLHHAPPMQRLPVLLLACVHTMVLAEPDHELARWYPNLTEHHRRPDDPALLATFKRFVLERASTLTDLLATKRTQTNEVGRCTILVLGLGSIADERGPIAHLDVGTSGGLNLLLDRYEYRFVPDDDRVPTSLGGPSTVTLTSATRGDLPLPTSLPAIAARCGIDVNPIDITSEAEAHWLEACIWPDQRDRFLRLRAAIEIAREHPPEILAGDATPSLDPAITRMARSGHPVVTNSWVLNYLTAEQRTAYVGELDRIGRETDMSWVFAESPALTSELPWHGVTIADPHLTVLAVARWRRGVRTVEFLATCHPHGYWMHAIG